MKCKFHGIICGIGKSRQYRLILCMKDFQHLLVHIHPARYRLFHSLIAESSNRFTGEFHIIIQSKAIQLFFRCNICCNWCCPNFQCTLLKLQITLFQFRKPPGCLLCNTLIHPYTAFFESVLHIALVRKGVVTILGVISSQCQVRNSVQPLLMNLQIVFT